MSGAEHRHPAAAEAPGTDAAAPSSPATGSFPAALRYFLRLGTLGLLLR